jgi:tetratricopeptide (TPR) repeat protein
MNAARLRVVITLMFLSLIGTSRTFAAYNLEVPVEPWDEYRLQFKNYSKHLLASYDRVFVDDYEGAIREVDKAIELLPEEGIGFAERSKYHRILNNATLADNNFKAAITLFNQAIERYRPGTDKKTKKGAARKTSPADASRLVATLRYQRGEAYFNFEQYKQASDDFAAACQGGNAAACSRIWDIKAIEKRGVQWVPLSARQYYDRRRVERPSPTTVRVWVRREESQPVQAESAPESYIQQHLELNCTTREFRLIEALVISGGSQSIADKITGSGFSKPLVGSAPSKLMITLCPHHQSAR